MDAKKSPGSNASPPVCWTWLLAALLACGCSSWRLPDSLAWKGRDEKPRVPDRVVDIWVDDILHQTGEASTRGFGGRIVFYHRDCEKPVKVDGTVTVYVFDDRCEEPMREPPIHKFVFPAATLARHYSESEVGHSYSFWVPIDEVGGPERKLTLITRFEPRLGGRILSKPSTHVLPGIPGEEPAGPLVQRYTKRLNGEIQPVQQNQPPAETAQPQSAGTGVSSATIQLPPSFARQMLAGPQNPAAAPATLPHAAMGPAPTGAVIPAGGPFSPPVPAAGVERASYTAAAQSVPAAPQAIAPGRSQPSRLPFQRDALGRPVASRVRRQPLSATWPSALPSTPRSALPAESPPAASQAVPPAEWEE